MDYQKINPNKNPLPVTGGGLSPVKLRNMLKKKKKQVEFEDEIESTTFSLASQVSEIDDSGNCLENYKDVDVVSVLGADNECRSKDQSLLNSRIRSQDEGYMDYDNGVDKITALPFEFQKTERASHRKPMVPFSKQAPSKWDDAQKWIASPTSSRVKNEPIVKKNNHGNRQPVTKVVVEVPDLRLVPYEEPDTKQIDSNQSKDNKGQSVSWDVDYVKSTVVDSYSKSVLMIGDSVGDSAINLSRHDTSLSIQNTTLVPPPTEARSVSMRDMGTEMTPIASQEPSRTGTPVRATTPSRSPSSSRPATPERTGPVSSTTTNNSNPLFDSGNRELSEKELQLKTRREIKALGTQLGKTNIAAWASKDEEDKDASTLGGGKSVIEVRAAAWEDAEKAKYMARFKREEVKIEAWENHQKAKTEAEMRRIEVEVERMRGGAHDRLMNKLAAARHKAEEKRAAAEAKRNREAARAEEQAAYIRKTGRIPSSFSCYCWCF
ncbi:uncharacterized protein [Rutidosis leptorrhynchoides]|uniref:uncharacterized protein isoform X1 n=1 Tax=Rutidosis leptorrhynchoides TaxID=125765 RepID=UPI003A99562C